MSKFPKDFIFGAATSAYQIEGATADGRGPSIWETFFRERPHLDNGDIGIGHYERMPEDVAIMQQLNLQSYRFSVSWSRILPSGKGQINQKGLDFYERLVDTLLEKNITPNLTLYHWDLPQALQDIGGWCSRDVAHYFGDYAAIVADRIGDRVPFWATLNEPEVIVAGYIGKELAPALEDYSLRMHVIHNLMLAHGIGIQALRTSVPKSKVGIVLNLVPIDPLDENSVEAARRHWLRDYAVYLEAIFKGSYPEVVGPEIKDSGVEIKQGDMKLISEKLDFLGINWYLRLVVNEQDQVIEVPNAEHTLMGWEIRPEALTRTLTSIWRDYNLPPIYITENGAALADTIKGNKINDQGRQRYIADHLQAISDAIAQGVNVSGYYVWSLFDNLEWSLGYSKTFGIIHVDRNTLERTPKLSARWYSDLIKRHLGS